MRIEVMEVMEVEAYATFRDVERAAFEVEVLCVMVEVEYEFCVVSVVRVLEM